MKHNKFIRIYCTIVGSTQKAMLCVKQNRSKITGKRPSFWLSKEYAQHVGQYLDPKTNYTWEIVEVEKWLYDETFGQYGRPKKKKPATKPKPRIFLGLNTNAM